MKKKYLQTMSVDSIQHKIYFIRGFKVMLDSDLADLYKVETFNLNKAVRRNSKRFPDDFMFRLSRLEYRALRFQIGILKNLRGEQSDDGVNFKNDWRKDLFYKGSPGHVG